LAEASTLDIKMNFMKEKENKAQKDLESAQQKVKMQE